MKKHEESAMVSAKSRHLQDPEGKSRDPLWGHPSEAGIESEAADAQCCSKSTIGSAHHEYELAEVRKFGGLCTQILSPHLCALERQGHCLKTSASTSFIG